MGRARIPPSPPTLAQSYSTPATQRTRRLGTMPPTVSGCPTATRPVVAREGLLMRIAIPGGRIITESLRAFAEGCAALGVAALDLTNRANIQVRGLSEAQADAVAALARRCALLPDADAGRRRAIVTSPLAGLDPAESVDPAPLVAALDAALLADARTDALSPKVGFGIDGGGRWPVARRSLDLVLAAHDGGWRLIAAGADLGLATDDPVGAVRALVGTLAAAGVERAKMLPRETLVAVFVAAGAAPVGDAHPRPAAKTLVGPVETGAADTVALGAVVPFGTLPIAAALALADLAGGEIRLSPDRTILVPRVARTALPAVRAALDAAGLSTDPASPYAILHACVGTEGCLRATTDVRAAARAIADALPAAPRGVRHIHVAGCARGCAHPRRADILLLATGTGGYALRRDADARAGDGIELAADLGEGEVAAAVRAIVDGGGIGV